MVSAMVSFQNAALKYYSYIINTILFLTLIGIGITAPSYLITFQYYLQIYLALFLIYRFNSFRTIKFNELDRRVAFSSGILLFSTTILGELMLKYAEIVGTGVSSKLSSVF